MSTSSECMTTITVPAKYADKKDDIITGIKNEYTIGEENARVTRSGDIECEITVYDFYMDDVFKFLDDIVNSVIPDIGITIDNDFKLETRWTDYESDPTDETCWIGMHAEYVGRKCVLLEHTEVSWVDETDGIERYDL